MIATRVRNGTPRAPVEMQDAVEMWARRFDRHARMEWCPVLGCFVIRLSLRPDDKRMEAYRQGRSEEPYEQVELMEWKTAAQMEGLPNWQQRRHPHTNKLRAGYVPMDIGDLGVSGVVTLLERGNTATGRGEYASLSDAVQDQARKQESAKEREKNAIKDAVSDRVDDRRREIMDIPFSAGGIDTTAPTTAQG